MSCPPHSKNLHPHFVINKETNRAEKHEVCSWCAQCVTCKREVKA